MPNSKFEIYQTGNSFHSNKIEAQELASKSFFGKIKEGKVIYSIYEVLFLLESHKAELIGKNDKKISFDELLKKFRAEHNSYLAFKDLRKKGYILKEGLKFGTDLRVYMPGDAPGKNHAKYLLHAIHYNEKLKPITLTSKARVAHSTKKILLLAIVDSEEDVSYYELNWKSIL